MLISITTVSRMNETGRD